MPTGTSGYLKPKNKTLKELDKASDVDSKPSNPVDNAHREMQRESELFKGITERIRNIFDD